MRSAVWNKDPARSDLKFMGRYADLLQVTGCDTGPIHAHRRGPLAVADDAERCRRVGRGMPVSMVLRGFA
ncbi:MAG: hypothetical protein RMI94_01360 [Bryobacterales bacterium]|nr:hypothetical protein [Bryobacteraceae bacterium]MDW8129170.1 hypothetical protein [Bryobacterales bacterium]